MQAELKRAMYIWLAVISAILSLKMQLYRIKNGVVQEWVARLLFFLYALPAGLVWSGHDHYPYTQAHSEPGSESIPGWSDWSVACWFLESLVILPLGPVVGSIYGGVQIVSSPLLVISVENRNGCGMQCAPLRF